MNTEEMRVLILDDEEICSIEVLCHNRTVFEPFEKDKEYFRKLRDKFHRLRIDQENEGVIIKNRDLIKKEEQKQQ